MEFSVSRSIQRLTPLVSTNYYPYLSSTPATNRIVPGLGHTIKQPRYIVTLPDNKGPMNITKSIETDDLDQNVEQTGGGSESDLPKDNSKTSIDQVLLHSMNHPRLIETGSISMQAVKPLKHKLEVKKSEPNIKKPKVQSSSKKPIVHKFQFM